MPFVAKKPSLYYASLANSTETQPLYIGLYLAGSFNDDQQNDFRKLGRMIRQTTRSIQCLSLRFREGDESVLAAFSALGDELAGSTAIQSLVFEGRVGTAEIRCLGSFFSSNALRGIQFQRTDVDASTFAMLKPFFSQTSTLKVLDLSANHRIGDECIADILNSLFEGGAQIETINIGEKFDAMPDERRILSRDGISLIATYINKTSSLLSISLHLINLDDNLVGEIVNVIKKASCSVRRLDLSGDFGNRGVQLLAEALETNMSVKTITLSCYKLLNDIGGHYLLNVVDPFSKATITKELEWEEVKRSNHTLQSLYILQRPLVTVSDNLITRLQSISSVNPQRTFQRKCWHHLEKNVEDISHLGLKSIHMPELISFVNQYGSLDHVFRLIRSNKTPELFTHPSPEKARLSYQMKQLENENRLLKDLLESERARVGEDRRNTSTSDFTCPCWILSDENAKKCWLLPWIKLWQVVVELLGVASGRK